MKADFPPQQAPREVRNWNYVLDDDLRPATVAKKNGLRVVLAADGVTKLLVP